MVPVLAAILLVVISSVVLHDGRIQKRFSEAEGYLRYAIQLWRQEDDNLMLANSLGTLGQVLVRQGEKARLFLDEAISLLGSYTASNQSA